MSAKQTTATAHWDLETDAVYCAVLEAVADATGVDPLDIDTPLYDVIDPDALDGLFRSTGRTNRSDLQLTFRYEGCQVTVDGVGTVTARLEPPVAGESLDTTSALEAGFGQ